MKLTQWIAQKISVVFNVEEYDASDIFKNPQFKPIWDDFFAGTGNPRILVYYQTQYKITDSGEIKDFGNPNHKEFFVTDGEKIKLKGKGIYFLRTKEQGKTVVSDTDVLFGEISESSITSLDVIINKVYKPMMADK